MRWWGTRCRYRVRHCTCRTSLSSVARALASSVRLRAVYPCTLSLSVVRASDPALLLGAGLLRRCRHPCANQVPSQFAHGLPISHDVKDDWSPGTSHPQESSANHRAKTPFGLAVSAKRNSNSRCRLSSRRDSTNFSSSSPSTIREKHAARIQERPPVFKGVPHSRYRIRL